MTLKTNSCSAVYLKAQQKADDVIETVSTFFHDEDLQWENMRKVCADGAPDLLASKSGFQSLVKKLAPQATDIYCMIDQELHYSFHRSRMANNIDLMRSPCRLLNMFNHL